MAHLFASSKPSHKLSAHSQYLRWGGKTPTAILVIPMPFYKPSYTGSTLAWVSAIPTTAPIAPIEYSLLWLYSRGQDFGRNQHDPHCYSPCLDCTITSHGSTSDIDVPHVRVIALIHIIRYFFCWTLCCRQWVSFLYFPFQNLILFQAKCSCISSSVTLC